MKKIALITIFALISTLLLARCGKSSGKITVETQSYNEVDGKLEKSGWQKQGTVDAAQGEVIYTNGGITAVVGNVGTDSIQVKFSGQVVCTEGNKPGDIFHVKRNRTYTFIAGGGTTGLEIKLRYN